MESVPVYGLRSPIRGLGIPPEIKKRLFEPFVSTKGDLGTGLGLWVSSRIVQKPCGTIRVKAALYPQLLERSSQYLCRCRPRSYPMGFRRNRMMRGAKLEQNFD